MKLYNRLVNARRSFVRSGAYVPVLLVLVAVLTVVSFAVTHSNAVVMVVVFVLGATLFGMVVGEIDKLVVYARKREAIERADARLDRLQERAERLQAEIGTQE